jgi:5-methylcytosine-specific restriction enzyme subunit McrC
LREGRIDIFPEVQDRKLFDIRFTRSHLFIYAGKFVGYVPLNRDVSVFIEPKVPVGNLLYLLDRAGTAVVEIDFLRRRYAAAQAAPRSILEAMARAFVEDLHVVQREGLAKEYVERDEEGQVLRGRLHFGASLMRHWSKGAGHRASFGYHEQTCDTRENRLLRYACHSLIRQLTDVGGTSRTLRELGELELFLADAGVALETPDRGRATEEPNRRDYEAVLRLAKTVCENQGVTLTSLEGEMQLPSFLVDLETAFEKYLLDVLKRKLEFPLVAVDGNRDGRKPLFDDAGEHLATPDIVIRRLADNRVIVDAKYKLWLAREDINQVLAYALSYRALNCVLVLPSESAAERGLSLVGTVGTVRLWLYRIHVGSEDIVEEESAFSHAIAALAE